ncbi:MAG: hypothetical protein LBR69_03105 [Endomicrobium sp.]|jgi:hypothetical protein|nr:hypothetical protein [Endomicrobium sp.]
MAKKTATKKQPEKKAVETKKAKEKVKKQDPREEAVKASERPAEAVAEQAEQQETPDTSNTENSPEEVHPPQEKQEVSETPKQEADMIQQILGNIPQERIDEYLAKNPGIEKQDPTEKDIKEIALLLSEEEFSALPEAIQEFIKSIPEGQGSQNLEEKTGEQGNTPDIPENAAESAEADPEGFDAKNFPLFFFVYFENGKVFKVSTPYALAQIGEKKITLKSAETGEEVSAVEEIAKAKSYKEASDLFLIAAAALDWENVRHKAQEQSYEKQLKEGENWPTARKSFARIK